MSQVQQMLDIASQVYDKLPDFYSLGRLWNKTDLYDLTKYDMLSMSSLFYIFSDKEDRRHLTDTLRENLGFEDPENAIRYYILHFLRSKFDAEMLFHCIPLAAGVILDIQKSKGRLDPLTTMILSSMEINLLATISHGDDMALTLPVIILRTWLDCKANTLLHADPEMEPFHDFMHWPSLEEFASIIIENEIEFSPYESMEDPELDRIAVPIFEHFLGLVSEGFLALVKSSEDPSFYQPYRDEDYSEYQERFRFIMKYVGDHHTYTDEYSSDEMELKQTVDAIFGIFDELEPHSVNTNAPASLRLREVARLDLLKFFLYLTESDEYISGKEVKAINECLNFSMRKRDVQDKIKELNVYTVTFEREIPLILTLLPQADRQLAEYGSGGISYTRRYVDLCEKAGYLFLKVDGSMNEDEKRDLETVMTTRKRVASEVEEELRSKDGK